MKWVYTDKINLHQPPAKLQGEQSCVSFSVQLLAGAHRYSLPDLKLHCERFLIGNVDTSNCIALYQVCMYAVTSIGSELYCMLITLVSSYVSTRLVMLQSCCEFVNSRMSQVRLAHIKETNKNIILDPAIFRTWDIRELTKFAIVLQLILMYT